MKCPYCNTPHTTERKTTEYNNFYVHIYECLECHKLFATSRQQSKLIKIPFYDNSRIPKLVKELSPTAFKLYCETLTLKSSGFNDFAGVGLRMALENLLWDYLAKFKNIPEEEMNGIRLTPMIRKIEALESGIYTKICAIIIREYGNESVHVNKNFPPISLDNALQAFEMLCTLMDNEMSIFKTNELLVPFMKEQKKR